MEFDTRLRQLKDLRNAGKKVVGYFPNGYMPEELVYACDAVPVALMKGGEAGPVSTSVPYLGRFLDPFCRSQIGYRILQEEDLYQMLDLFIVPITDIHVRGVADSWNFFTPVEVVHFAVPHARTIHGFKYYMEELNAVKERLERLTGNRITDQRLNQEIKLTNKLRDLLKKISLLRRVEAPPISGKDFIALNHSSLFDDRNALIDVLESLYDELRIKDEDGNKRPRVLLTGSTLAQGDSKVTDMVEAAGASIVMEAFCEGMRDYWQSVDTHGDPVQSLANALFTNRVPGAFFRGAARERFDFLLNLARDFRVNGAIWYGLMYRESYDIEAYLFPRIMEPLGVPVLKLTSDYDASGAATLRTRIETFVETIRGGKTRVS